jgi:hypothetical protein
MQLDATEPGKGKTMDTVIVVLQILSIAVLAAGTVYSLVEIMRKSASGRFSYSTANDFETDFRRVARNAQ